MRIVINGAGIAGPTLAYWLSRYGYTPVLVEHAPRLRTAGYVVDFWGVGYDIAEKMGILPDVLSKAYDVRELRFVGQHGQWAGGFSVDVFRTLTGGRFTSLSRGDLSAAIYSTIASKIETLFADGITGIKQDKDGVLVEFAQAAPRRFDLVIGADGFHSNVRLISFGTQDEFVKPLGYYVAAFESEGYRPRDELVYVSFTLPGRQAARFALHNDRTLFLFVFHREFGGADEPDGDSHTRAVLHRVFDNAGWECPQILAAMDCCEGLYFDCVGQIRMNRWTKGRVALIGDAAFCPSLLAGEGAGLSMMAAYVLAGELHRAQGDYETAFKRYEQRLGPFIREKQKSAERFGSWIAPRTPFGIFCRNFLTRLMLVPPLARLMLSDLRDDICLPEYEGPARRSDTFSR